MTGSRARLLLTAGAVGLLFGLLPLASSSAAPAAVPHLAPIVAVNASQSNNWSGYNLGAETSGRAPFHSITGTWVVPTATAHKDGESEFSSAWVGIGGGCVNADCSKTDNSLIQAGTEQDINYDPVGGGTPAYSAWYELIPNTSITVDLDVHPGDTITVDIHEVTSGSQHWSILIKNLKTGKSFGKEVDYTSTYATAEWIVETPTVVALGVPPTVGFAPLANLTKVTFRKATVNGANPGFRVDDEVQLVDFFGNVMAAPSAPNTAKNAFNLCTYKSSCPAP